MPLAAAAATGRLGRMRADVDQLGELSADPPSGGMLSCGPKLDQSYPTLPPSLTPTKVWTTSTECCVSPTILGSTSAEHVERSRPPLGRNRPELGRSRRSSTAISVERVPIGDSAQTLALLSNATRHRHRARVGLVFREDCGARHVEELGWEIHHSRMLEPAVCGAFRGAIASAFTGPIVHQCARDMCVRRFARRAKDTHRQNGTRT